MDKVTELINEIKANPLCKQFTEEHDRYVVKYSDDYQISCDKSIGLVKALQKILLKLDFDDCMD